MELIHREGGRETESEKGGRTGEGETQRDRQTDRQTDRGGEKERERESRSLGVLLPVNRCSYMRERERGGRERGKPTES